MLAGIFQYDVSISLWLIVWFLRLMFSIAVDLSLLRFNLFLYDFNFHAFGLLRGHSGLISHDNWFDGASEFLFFLFGELSGLLITVLDDVKESISIDKHGFANYGNILVHRKPLNYKKSTSISVRSMILNLCMERIRQMLMMLGSKTILFFWWVANISESSFIVVLLLTSNYILSESSQFCWSQILKYTEKSFGSMPWSGTNSMAIYLFSINCCSFIGF